MINWAVISLKEELNCKFSSSINYFLLNPGNKRPHFGNIYFKEDVHKLEFRSKPGEREENEKVETKKIIELKGN